MTISIEQLLQNSFVISINQKQYDTFCNVFNNCKLNPIPRVFSGYTIKNGIYKEYGMVKTKNHCNCSLSHMAIVKMAKCLDLDFVCIFEDDVIPLRNISEVLPLYISNIDNDIDVLKLGTLNFSTCKKYIYNDRFLISNNTIGGHAYIIFKKYYDQYERFSSIDIRPDTLVLNSKSNKILMCNQNLFIQRNISESTSLHKDQPFRCSTSGMTKDKVYERYAL